MNFLEITGEQSFRVVIVNDDASVSSMPSVNVLNDHSGVNHTRLTELPIDYYYIFIDSIT